MENNLDNKAKFFAQYWGQAVMRYDTGNVIYGVEGKLVNTVDEKDYLQLKPLSSISDEDAIELWDKLYLNNTWANKEKIYAVHTSIGLDSNDYTFFEVQIIVDFLRSKGYALPFGGLSVEQLVKYNWLRLSE